jgi:polyhydroxyalkanoate synthesis regulator phasin
MDIKFYTDKVEKIIDDSVDENDEIDTRKAAEKIVKNVLLILEVDHDKKVEELEKEITDLEDQVEDLEMEGG